MPREFILDLERAIAKAGSEARLADVIGFPQTTISYWRRKARHIPSTAHDQIRKFNRRSARKRKAKLRSK